MPVCTLASLGCAATIRQPDVSGLAQKRCRLYRVVHTNNHVLTIPIAALVARSTVTFACLGVGCASWNNAGLALVHILPMEPNKLLFGGLACFHQCLVDMRRHTAPSTRGKVRSEYSILIQWL